MCSKVIRDGLQGGGCTGDWLVCCFGSGFRDMVSERSRLDKATVELEKKIKRKVLRYIQQCWLKLAESSCFEAPNASIQSTPFNVPSKATPINHSKA